MLPPPLRPGARPRSLSMPALPATQTRTFLGWRRARCWDSHIDPNYHRYNSWRNLKDRARLVKSVQRRARFDWDIRTRSLFSPRYASHWNGNGNRPPLRYSGVHRKQEPTDDEADPYELSKREKAWRDEQAKAEHVKQDQLWKHEMEALRKRLEADPYETVFGKRFEPFWSYWFPREDYGLPHRKSETTTKEPVDIKATTSKIAAQPADDIKPDTVRKSNRPPSSFGYASSTTWNSWTNKTQRTEWDSVSGEKKHFEYDPVSNRMVRIDAPQNANINAVEGKALTNSPPMSLANKDNASDSKPAAQTVPKALPASGSRKSIPIPTIPVEHGSSKHDLVKARLNAQYEKTTRDEERALAERSINSDGARPGVNDKPKQTRVTPLKPTETSLESLTADDLRASMGKNQDSQGKQQHQTNLESNYVQDQLQGVDPSIDRLRGDVASIVDQVMPSSSPSPLQTSLERGGQISAALLKSRSLQPAVERMQSKAQTEPVDFDDSAAHESTEPISIASSVPKAWNEQADLLQSDRVKRTSGKLPFPPVPRWLDDMEAKKAAYEKNKAAQPISPADAQKAARLERANALLEAEVAAQKTAMSKHEEDNANKIRSLRGELKAMSKKLQSDKKLYRKEAKHNSPSEQAASGSTKIAEIEIRYREKIRALKAELDIAYKQSSIHADEFLDRIRKLEAEVACKAKPELATPVRKDSGVDMEMDIDAKAATHSEGDFCTNVTKYTDSSKWYKIPQLSQADLQKARDQALVRDVRKIYEGQYGIIDTEHRQVKDVALEQALSQHDAEAVYSFKDDGLESELENGPKVADLDDGYAPKDYEYKTDGLEADLKNQDAQEVEYASDAYEAAARPSGQSTPVKAPQTPLEDLETVLKRQADEKAAYASDAYEAEAQQCTTSKVHAINSAQEDLESILKQQAAQKTAYASDEYEREAQECTTRRVNAALKSVQNDLEAELKRQAAQKVAYTSDEYEAASPHSGGSRTEKTLGAVQEDLESTLKKQAAETAAYASDEYEAESLRNVDRRAKQAAQVIREDLETTLKRQAADKAAYASDEYEAASRSAFHNTHENLSTFREDGLESELKARGAEKAEYASDAYEAAASQATNAASEPSNASATESLQWHHPPLYKVLAYDAGNDLMSTATTSSWLAESKEQAMSISHALDQLYQPARFVPRFAEMQEEGFQVVHAGKDVLVFKKVLQAPQQSKAETTSPPPVASHLVNPVDGTVKPREDVKPATGNFASPTGFVNYDPVPEAERPIDNGRIQDEWEDVDYKHYPRVKREERVFSGTKRVGRRKWAQRRRASKVDEDADEGNGGVIILSGIIWMVVVVAGIAYVTGWRRESKEIQKAAIEAKAAQEAREAKEVLDKGRWRLDGGFWKKGD